MELERFTYVLLIFGLFVVPRVLQRWRIPTAIAAFALGGVAGAGFGLLQHDDTLKLLSTFGIVGLFLFAGLEVELDELQRGRRPLAQHLIISAVLLALVAAIAVQGFGMPFRAAVLVALAVVIPSTGFILDSLGGWGLSKDEQFWVKGTAIATEFLALGVLFVVLQSSSVTRLAIASLAMTAMILVLPPIFRLFAVRVAPWAPRSEFAFLMMMAVVMATITRELGAYYLVGAFVVGIAARRLRDDLPAVASQGMLHAVETFASFFAPFYFFVAGTGLQRGDFSWSSLLIGLALLGILVPVRIATVLGHRSLALREPWRDGLRVAVPLLPTLVFTLVVAGILRDQFGVGSPLYGALIIYAVLSTVLPGFIFRTPTPVFDAPTLED
ncbi:MAG: cation:proton antiporter [Gemmatimonadetes bacterium]|nr:cation:proton antiporter [Gemmatimonadota bacterium]